MSIRGAADVVRRARSPRELARLVPRWRKLHILNDERYGEVPPSPGEAIRTLRGLRNQLKGAALDEHGRVDYARLRDSEVATELDRASRVLTELRPEQLEGDYTRTAFWINLYNVLAIHGVIALGIRESVMEVPSFFGAVAYRIGDHIYTLDEIENGVLRRNGRHPASKRRPFAGEDPRLACCPSVVDPRIHAALVCASTSCPPVGFYDPEHLDEQLRRATEHYVEHEVSIDHGASTITYPITFHYYADDFEDVPAFVLAHAPEPHRDQLEQAYAGGYKIRYARYDWSLNSVI
jgi:hypothetical protein